MREEQGWECEEQDGNAGTGNLFGNAKNLGENAENVGNHGSDVGNQGRNLSIAVKMAQNSNGNDKFKEWGEVKIIENVSTFVKTYFHTFDFVHFLLSSVIFRKCLSVFIIDFEQVNTGWEG